METHHIEETHTETMHLGAPEDHEPKDTPLFIRIIIGAGIIVVLFLISVAIVKFVPRMFSAIGNIFGRNSIEVGTNSKEVISGNDFALNWENKTEDKEGIYTVNFTCAENIKIEYESRDGKKPVICNTLFPLPANANSYPFTVSSENKDKENLKFIVNLWDMETNEKKLEGDGKIAILPFVQKETNEKPEATEPKNNTPVNPVATSTSNNPSNTSSKPTYSGNPDLAIRLVSMGYVDPFGNFRSGQAIPAGARVLVKFNVSNIGTNVSGAWSVNATLPSADYTQRNFISKTEPSLTPGVSFNMDIAFDNFDPNAGGIYINLVNSADSNTANNSLTVQMSY